MVPPPARAFDCATIAAAAPGGATAGHYPLIGVVSGVEAPYGAPLAPASVGATVSGLFQYDPSAHDGVGHLDTHSTAYLNRRLSSGASGRTGRCN
jgi:hypothetical protein